MNSKIQAISSFLTERKERLKPEEANELNLKRIEKIDFSGQIHLVENKPTKTGMIVIKKGDLVISGINVAKGALAVYEGDEDVIATIHYSSYSFDKEKIDINFLKWFLKSPAFIDALKKQTGGGIKTEIKAKKFLSLKVPIPILDEQKKIESNLNKFEEKYNQISKELQTQLELINKLRSSILSDAVSGKLVPQDPNDESAEVLLEKIKAEKEKLIKEGKIKKQKPLPPISEDEIPYELPDGWVWTRLQSLVTILGDGLHGTPIYTNDTNYYFINGNNLSNGKIEIKSNTKTVSFQEFTKYQKNLSQNTVLVSINGTLGNVAFYNNEEIILGKSACYFNLFNEVYKYYIKYLIESPYYLDYALNHATGSTIKNLSLKAMNNFLVPLPPLEEQKRIVEKVEKLMATCDALELEVQNSKIETEKLMQSVLKEAFEK